MSLRIHHSKFFFNFQHGQAKETTGNERVKISKIALSEIELVFQFQSS